MRPNAIGTRFLLASLAVALVTVIIVTLGVLRIGGEAFTSLMAAAGDSADHARQMFDESVATVVWVAAIVGVAVAVALSASLARRLARPIERMARAADRVAGGDLTVRVAEEGPDELRSLAASYNAMTERLAEQEAIRREFIVNASHELRTPLTNLQGYLEALRDGVLPPEPATFDSLREEVDRLTRLAASLDVLAGEPGDRPAPRTVDLAAIVRSAAELTAPALARRSIALEVSVGEPLVVTARADDIAQVISNLLQNAVRYTPAGGRVVVEAARTDDGATVRVANTGPGIPAEDLPRVWERFYRVEKSRDRGRGGAGVGLAIVRQLVEEAGGWVGARSDTGWTTFWFSLPA
ncbi:MAG: sensor histidine kinase [Chloroflexota bacterium]